LHPIGIRQNLYRFSLEYDAVFRGEITVPVDPRSLKNMLGWLIGGTQGGYTRFLILRSLHESPSNANQLATLLSKDYTTIRHHLKVLEENKMIISLGKDYARTYALSSLVEENYRLVEEISEIVLAKTKKLKKRLSQGSDLFLVYEFEVLKRKAAKWRCKFSFLGLFSFFSSFRLYCFTI
jgi:DNA-binding transcriptional ArsR family regulator